MKFDDMWASLLPIGRVPETGGYERLAWTPAELDCRAWFIDQARSRGLHLEHDRNGNLIAWWHFAAGDRGPGVLTGSHLDSVPGGGAFDGPLGVVGAFAAIDLLRDRGFVPARPIGIAAFAEEEGSRFGVACLGSRLLTGAIEPDRARALRDADGVTFADTLAAHDLDPETIGRDDELLGRIACFVEMHIEQGRFLDDADSPVGVATAIRPHGRWRFDFTGQADHAGTTQLPDRRDPMLPFAHTTLRAREIAAEYGTLATVGKVRVRPGGVNVISAQVTGWLDARGPDDLAVRRTVDAIREAAERSAAQHGVQAALTLESYSQTVLFDETLATRLANMIMIRGSGRLVPSLPTGAGHDAGVLSAQLPAAMLFVRNPTGISHAPQERAEPADCHAGIAALAEALGDLAGHAPRPERGAPGLGRSGQGSGTPGPAPEPASDG